MMKFIFIKIAWRKFPSGLKHCDQINIRRVPTQTAPSDWLSLETKPRYKTASDFWVINRKQAVINIR